MPVTPRPEVDPFVNGICALPGPPWQIGTSATVSLGTGWASAPLQHDTVDIVDNVDANALDISCLASRRKTGVSCSTSVATQIDPKMYPNPGIPSPDRCSRLFLLSYRGIENLSHPIELYSQNLHT